MDGHNPAAPLTADEALRLAREWVSESGSEPDTIEPFPYPELETARYGRGYAFREAAPGGLGGYLLITENWGRARNLLFPGDTIEAAISEHLAKAERVDRVLADAESHRLAVAAFDAGADFVDRHPDALTAEYAQYLLLEMRAQASGSQSGRGALDEVPSLLEPAEPGRQYLHNCPLCRRPVIHRPPYPREVCRGCFQRTADQNGRPIRGGTNGLAGGFLARYVDPPRERCAEITETGRCFIDGRPALIGEDRSGGVVVEAL